MAPHLSPVELDEITVSVANGKTAQAILSAIAKRRARAKIDAPKIWAVRRAMAGATHKRGVPESRERKKKLTTVQASRMFKKRGQLIVKDGGEQYVSYDAVVASSRVPKIHRTTVSRYLGESGVKWRRMREKPPRTECHEEDRMEVCRIWRNKPATFWTDSVDLIIDAKKYATPGNAAAARRLRQQ